MDLSLIQACVCVCVCVCVCPKEHVLVQWKPYVKMLATLWTGLHWWLVMTYLHFYILS